MATRARLVPPPPQPKTVWHYHKLNHITVFSSALLRGDRRMEADTYLSTGSGIRIAIESKPHGWLPFHKFANVWKPGRAKGILVSPEFGVPFLTATQVFDARPIARKYVSAEQTKDADLCMATEGQIVVTCSGNVGRSTALGAAHSGMMISNDLLRVDTIDSKNKGWVYAFLKTPQARAMTTGLQYGHIIKHLEVSHLATIPVPIVDEKVAANFSRRFDRILRMRDEGHRMTLDAEARFERSLGSIKIGNWGDKGFVISESRAFLKRRRRLEASFHNPGVAAIRKHLTKYGSGFTKIADAGYDVWVPGRYKRIPADDGVIYRDSADILEVSPDLTKRFADSRFGDRFGGRVKSGWVLIPSSGQVYGIIGTAILATDALNDQVVSNHVIRLAPRENAGLRAGYLVTALSHLTFGRPLVKALAFGSSVPEIDSQDLAELEIVRLKPSEESAIANLAEAAAVAQASADILESEMIRDASAIVESFMTKLL